MDYKKKLQIYENQNYDAKNQTLIRLKSCHCNRFLIGYYKVSFYVVAKINFAVTKSHPRNNFYFVLTEDYNK